MKEIYHSLHVHLFLKDTIGGLIKKQKKYVGSSPLPTIPWGLQGTLKNPHTSHQEPLRALCSGIVMWSWSIKLLSSEWRIFDQTNR